MSPARRGSLITATWLIGLGVVFLARELAHLNWREAWPWFVILAGGAAFVSTAVGGRISGGPWAFTWPLVWSAIGVVLLLSTTGNLGAGPVEVIVNWWPWLAVGLGIWFLVGAFVPQRAGPRRDADAPTRRGHRSDDPDPLGCGELTTRPAANGRLVHGEFPGGVTHRQQGPGRIELEQDTTRGWPWLDHRSSWTVGLTAEVPLDLRVDAGASRTLLDLRDLRCEASTSTPAPARRGSCCLGRPARRRSRAEAEAASLVLDVPDGVAARIRTRVVLGSIQVDQSRFPSVAGGYESPDYLSAANR